jgi:hypothetical protein
LNGLENKAKYGTGYYGYSYGNYANGYYEEERSKSGIKNWRENPKEIKVIFYNKSTCKKQKKYGFDNRRRRIYRF